MTIIFPDPVLAVRDQLREILPELGYQYTEGLVASSISHRDAIPGEPRPWIRVANDGTFRDARLDGRAVVRVLVWDADGGKATALARLAEALLLDAPGTASLRGCTPISGPLTTDDPDTDEPLAYFTVTARLRPTHL